MGINSRDTPDGKKVPALRRNSAARVGGASGLNGLLGRLRGLIASARGAAARSVDCIQVETCWQVGRHIVEFEQAGNARASYGTRLLSRLADKLSAEFGKGFDERNLRHMRAFYAGFPIRNALRSELSWTHYRALLRVDDAAARNWYMKEAALQNWSSRALERQIGTLYYERLLASKDRKSVRLEAKAQAAKLGLEPREFVRDPVMLEFLGLPETGRLLESDLEKWQARRRGSEGYKNMRRLMGNNSPLWTLRGACHKECAGFAGRDATSLHQDFIPLDRMGIPQGEVR